MYPFPLYMFPVSIGLPSSIHSHHLNRRTHSLKPAPRRGSSLAEADGSGEHEEGDGDGDDGTLGGSVGTWGATGQVRPSPI